MSTQTEFIPQIRAHTQVVLRGFNTFVVVFGMLNALLSVLMLNWFLTNFKARNDNLMRDIVTFIGMQYSLIAFLYFIVHERRHLLVH